MQRGRDLVTKSSSLMSTIMSCGNSQACLPGCRNSMRASQRPSKPFLRLVLVIRATPHRVRITSAISQSRRSPRFPESSSKTAFSPKTRALERQRMAWILRCFLPRPRMAACCRPSPSQMARGLFDSSRETTRPSWKKSALNLSRRPSTQPTTYRGTFSKPTLQASRQAVWTNTVIRSVFGSETRARGSRTFLALSSRTGTRTGSGPNSKGWWLLPMTRRPSFLQGW